MPTPATTAPSLKELRIAVEVAATGSFRAAAKRLDMAPSTLSHAVTALERGLGMRLFHRTTRSVAVTPEGVAFLGRIGPLVSGLDAALAAPGADPAAISGPLRINAPFSAASHLLRAVVPVFSKRFPLVELEIRHEERMVDIVAQGCDAGIRLGRTVPNDMIGVGFGGRLRWALVAAPDYLREHGEPAHPRDLMAHLCIRVRMPGGERYAWEFERGSEAFSLDVPGSLTLDRIALSIEAATRGLGIGYVLLQAAEERLAAGTLRQLLPEWMPDEDGYVLYYPGRRRVRPQLRAFVDVLRAAQSRRDPDGV